MSVLKNMLLVFAVLLCASQWFNCVSRLTWQVAQPVDVYQMSPTTSTCPAAAAAAGCGAGAHLQAVLRPAWDFLPLLEAVLAGLEAFAGFAAEAALPLAGRARNLSQYLPASLTDGAALLQLLEVRAACPAAAVARSVMRAAVCCEALLHCRQCVYLHQECSSDQQ
jgi:hypothetical protein